MLKLIISDLDGTLLLQGEKALSEDLFHLITEMKERGVSFAVASGRPYIELKKLFAPVLYDMYFICENGAVILYRGRVLQKTPLSLKRNDRETVRAFSEELGSLAIAGTHTIYTIRNNPMVSAYYQKKHLSVMKLPSLAELPEPCVRLSVCRESLHEEQVAGTLESCVNGGLHVIYEDDKWIDIVAEGVHKGAAARFLQELCEAAPEETLVFGDNDNDRELFQVTPHSYAMAWASDGIKKEASAVTDCVIRTVQQLW